MSAVDWLVTLVPLFLVLGAGLYCRPYARSVVNFMAGGRSAGRYLLAIANSEMGLGSAVFVGAFEATRQSGFTLGWWSSLTGPLALVVAISGFVVYRFRETRAMTLSQFFEIRYSKSFRLFTGMLGFVAGCFNFGIIPAIGARCLVYFLGLPPELTAFGHVLPTYIPLMAFFLSITLFVALSGGVITVMVINCLEGILSQFFYVVITFALLAMFHWSQIAFVLTHLPNGTPLPAGRSLLNPFNSGHVSDFNLWYVLMLFCFNVYATRAWQNAGAYYAASYTPHESVMAAILGRWRDLGKVSAVTLLGVGALTFMQHPDFSVRAAPVLAAVGHIADHHVQEQMYSPIALSALLPIGVKGAFCVVLLMGIFGGDATHLHSWGSIFIQDVLVPLRKKPFGPRQHIRILRFSIVGVAVFAFAFGCLFRQTEYVFMWWNVTMAIYVGGAGAAIIGGLYWKKGTTAGAWTGLLTGSSLAFGGILARELNDKLPLNGTQISFFSCLIAFASYVIVSWLTCRKDFDMDHMLHRNEHASLQMASSDEASAPRNPLSWSRIIGMNSSFTLGDKWIAGILFAWTSAWWIVFLIVSAWNLVHPWADSSWAAYWHFTAIIIPALFAIIMSVWFTWGGLTDMRDLFRRLDVQKSNPLDDGTVVGHQNLDEAVTTNRGSSVPSA